MPGSTGEEPPSPKSQRVVVCEELVFVKVAVEPTQITCGPVKLAEELVTTMYEERVMLSVQPFASVTMRVTL